MVIIILVLTLLFVRKSATDLYPIEVSSYKTNQTSELLKKTKSLPNALETMANEELCRLLIAKQSNCLNNLSSRSLIGKFLSWASERNSFFQEVRRGT